MKMTYKSLSIIATIGYLLGIMVVTYFLLNLPQELEKVTLGMNNNILANLNLAFVKLNVSIAMVLALGLTAALLLLLNDQKEKVISPLDLHSTKFNTEEIKKVPQANNGLNEVQAEEIINFLSLNSNLRFTTDRILSSVCNEVEASQGAVFKAQYNGEKRNLHLIASFAYPVADSKSIIFEFGEGLLGQAAKENKILNIDSVPEGYIQVLSGLGNSSPTNLLIVPFMDYETENVWGVVEISSFHQFTKNDENLILKIFSSLAASFPAKPVIKHH